MNAKVVMEIWGLVIVGTFWALVAACSLRLSFDVGVTIWRRLTRSGLLAAVVDRIESLLPPEKP